MKVFNENVKTKTHKGDRNMLVVETKHEIFFGVFNVKLNGKFYVAEQVAEFDGTPILKLPVEINGVIEERLFDVVVGSDTGIVFNPDITSEQMLESATNVNENPLDIDEVFKPKVIEEDISMSEEDVSELIYGNTKEQPSNFDTESPLKYGNTTRDIDQIVLNLEKSIGSLQEKAQSTIKDYTNRQLKKLKQLSENGIQNSPQFIETAKTELVSEFVKITENIKLELSQSNINSRKDISNTLEYKLANAVNEFDEKIKTQFENYSQIYNDTISQYIDTIFETTVKPATSELMLQVSEDLNSQVEEFKTEVSESLSDKISNNELREFEEIFSDNSQRLISANINLNNKIDQISKKIITEAIIDNKIADNIKKIEEHFDTNITAVSEKADTLDEATREYLLSVIAESRQTLLNEISAIKDNVAVEYIVENKKKTEKLDVLTLKSELQKDLDLKVSNAIVNLKKFTAYYGGGGGTVAVQFADGGTMNGDLTVVGAISASQYLGLSYLLNDYLPLSGGTVTGNVTVTGSVSADRIYTTQLDALSANITVIDIKQYELSGFNVTGDVTINGSVSAQNISAANLYSNGVQVATVVDPVRTTLTGNGVLSTFAISGAGSLVNPSALIVAIDGALQEPVVDYTVSGGSITFTSPLANGSKAVVISPVNTIQVGQVTPSDGSVTSAKLDNALTIQNLTSPLASIDSLIINDQATAENQTYGSFDSILTPRVNAGLRGYILNRKCNVGGTWATSHTSGGGSTSRPSHVEMFTNTTLGSKSYIYEPQLNLCELGAATRNGYSTIKWDMSEMWFDWVFNMTYAIFSSNIRTNQIVRFFAGDVSVDGMIGGYAGGIGVRIDSGSSATNYDIRIFHGFGLPYSRAGITAATNASPIVVTQNNHGFQTNDQIEIDGCTGNTATNGIWTVTRINGNTYSLNGSTGNGTLIAGGGSHYISNVLLNTNAFGGKLARIHIHKTNGVFNVWLNDTILIGSVTYVASGDPSGAGAGYGFGSLGMMAKTLVASTGSTNMYVYELNYGGKV